MLVKELGEYEILELSKRVYKFLGGIYTDGLMYMIVDEFINILK